MLGYLHLKLNVETWAFSEAQERLYISDGTRLLEWDLKTKQLLNVLTVGTPVKSISFSEDGRFVVTAGDEAKFWELSKLKPDLHWALKQDVIDPGPDFPAWYRKAQK